MSARPDNSVRLLALCGVVAPIFFTIVVIVLSLLRPSYDQVSQTISELGSPGAPNAIIQDANFMVTGLLIIAFAFGLRRGIPALKGSRGPSLVVVQGIARVAVAFFPISANHNGGIMDVIHISLALVGWGSFIIATFVFSGRLRKDDSLKAYGTYSKVTGVLATIFLVGFLLSLPTSFTGAVERLLAGNILLWIEIMALMLMRFSGQPKAGVT